MTLHYQGRHSNFFTLCLQITEPTELRFSIYNSQTKTFITEEYEILLTINGMPADASKIGNLKTIFTVITCLGCLS